MVSSFAAKLIAWQKRLGGGAAKDSAAPEGAKSGGSTRDVLKGLFGR